MVEFKRLLVKPKAGVRFPWVQGVEPISYVPWRDIAEILLGAAENQFTNSLLLISYRRDGSRSFIGIWCHIFNLVVRVVGRVVGSGRRVRLEGQNIRESFNTLRYF